MAGMMQAPAPAGLNALLRKVTVTALAGATCTIQVVGDPAGVTHAGVAWLGPLPPIVNGRAMALTAGGTWLVLGPVGPTARAQSADVATSQTTTSTSYTNLTTTGPQLTLDLVAGQQVLVIVSASVKNSVGGAGNQSLASFDVSGGTTLAASDANAVQTSFTTSGDGNTLSRATPMTASGDGSTVFTMKYKVTASTGTYADRRLVVWC